MANITIDDDLRLKLSEHMAAYLGADLSELLDDDFTSDDDISYTLVTEGEFLNTVGSLNVYVVKDAESIIFCIKPTIAAKTFGEYFPQMIPQDPWLTGTNPKLAFPNLADRKVPNIQWWYVCVIHAKSKKEVSDALWQSFNKATGEDEKLVKLMRSISRDDDFYDEKTGWQGGLFYFGSLPKLPIEGMIPENMNTAWGAVVDNVNLQGCVYHQSLLPHLKFQIPITNKPEPFDSKVIKKIEFAAVFSSALDAVEQPEPEDKEEKKKIAQDREASLAGYIDFGSQNIQLKGVWPFDDDVFKIEAQSELANLSNYLGDFSNLVPNDIAVAVAFKISKSKKQLESIKFTIAGNDWMLVPNIFTIKQAKFTCNITHPGSVNMVTAKFWAKAQIGAGDKVMLLCNGVYPDGEISLYLDTKKEVFISDVLAAFTSKSVGFGNSVVVTKLGGNYDLGTKYLAFQMAVEKTTWDTADLGFSLDKLTIGVFGGDSYTFKLDANFSYSCKKIPAKVLNFTGGAEYDGGWRFSGTYDGNISLKEIALEFGASEPPSQLDAFQFTKMVFAFESAAGLKLFAGECLITLFKEKVKLALNVQKINTDTYFSGDFTDKNSSNKFKIEFIKNGTGYKLGLQMLFTIAGTSIYLNAKSEGGDEKITEKSFAGGTKGLDIHLIKVLEEVLKSVDYLKDFPIGFLPDIKLNDVFVNYDSKTKQTDIIAYANLARRQVRFFIQYKAANTDTDTKAVYVFGVDTNVASLEQLPLVGGEMKDVKLSGVGFIYASGEGKYKLPKLSKPGTDGLNTIEYTDAIECKNGVTLVGNINLPGEEKPIMLALPVSKRLKSMLLQGTDGIMILAEPFGTFDPAVKWLNINKKIGPVAVNKLGFKFAEGQLSLLISGALMLSDLSINVEGLGLSFSPGALIKGENIDPQFNLSGLGLALEKKPLEISGLLLRNDPKPTESISFYGAAQISTSSFSIKGIGAYSQLKENKTDSLFIYGLYSGPIGGPALFFVTGIAAGFGYNRTIRVPRLEEVKDFPLVAMVLSSGKAKTNTEMLDDLIKNDWIPASAGDFWMAIGVRFTSFKIIESFVLVTIKFGGKVEFAIIGLSLLKWPNKGDALVYIELALLAKFGPDSDVIAVTGMLTPNSYLFDKNCKLTGGFAFYTWISGPHEGDFVITLGGYAPSYNVPAHYPMVDRLALNWKLSDALSIHGEMYFALTPKEIMAGGKWEIAYNLSFLSARVTIWADMYISWAPFHYELEAGIIVRIEANIKIAFIHVHFKLQMGCVVYIWGPPFSGQIYVDWSIFSFTIPFGDGSRPEPAKLTWETNKLLRSGESGSEGFKESFVPLDKQKNPIILDVRLVGGIVNDAEIQPEVIKPIKGEQKDTEKDKPATVNAYDLIIAVDSFFPVKEIYTINTSSRLKKISSGDVPLSKATEDTLMMVAGEDIPKTIKDRETGFGVKPMGVTTLDTELHVRLISGNDTITKNISIIGTAKGVNSALWSAEPPPPPKLKGKKGKAIKVGKEKEAVIKNVLTGIQLYAVEDEDKNFKEIKLKDRYNVKPVNIELKTLIGKTAGEQKGIKSSIKESLESEKSSTALKTVDTLQRLGFTNLYHDEDGKMLYTEILNNDPIFAASIGQLLPSKDIS